MRIDPSNSYLNNLASNGLAKTPGEAHVSPSSTAPELAAPNAAGDTVSLSGTLSTVQQLKVQLSQVPELRAARVAALQQQLQQGSYHPSSDAIAASMLADLSKTGGS